MRGEALRKTMHKRCSGFEKLLNKATKWRNSTLESCSCRVEALHKTMHKLCSGSDALLSKGLHRRN